MKTTDQLFDEINDVMLSKQKVIARIDEFVKERIEFVNRFIPVEEQLPEDSDNLTQTEKYIYTENTVLVLTANGKHAVSKRSKFKQNKNSKWEWMGSSSFSDSVTHWRPI